MLTLAKQGKKRRAATPMMRPGYEGKMELAPGLVDDPNPLFRGKQQVVVRNIRESSLATMRARDQIDEAQYRAGDWIRRKIEQSRMSVGAIDPSYEPVDTSGHADPIPDRVIIAQQALGPVERHITRELGRQGWLVVRLVCGEGESVSGAANRRYGLATRAQERATGQLLRDALDEAAIYLGYAQRRHLTAKSIDKARA